MKDRHVEPIDGNGAAAMLRAPSRPRGLWRWIGALLVLLLVAAAGIGWLEWRRSVRVAALVAELKSSNAVIRVTRGGPDWLNRGWPDRPWIGAFDAIELVDVSVHDEPRFEDLVARLGDCGRTGVLNLSYRSTENEHLRGLSSLSLVELRLQFTHVDDAGLAHFRSMPGLQVLSLEGSPVTDAGLPALQGLRGLRELDLRETRVTDAGLASLAPLASLERLWLSRTSVRGPGLAHLGRLPALRSLSLGEAEARDWQIESLADLSNVTELTIFGDGITDEHVPIFARMTALESLSLTSTSVTDEGLRRLHGRMQLKRVELYATRCTRHGVAALQKALPGATIESRFGNPEM